MNSPSQQYEISIEERPGYLYARIKAFSAGPQAFQDLLQHIADECRRCKCTKALIYRDVPSMPGIGNTFQIVGRIEEMLRGIRIALVNPYPSNAAQLAFAVSIASGRGIDFKVFNTEPDAREWLGVK